MLKVNEDKAREYAKDRIRRWRENEFKKNDVLLQNALIDNDSSSLEIGKNRREYLRNLPQDCDGKTLDELRELLKSLELS